MKINFPKTTEKLTAAGLTRSSWAKSRGFEPPTVLRIFWDPTYPEGRKKTAVVEKLREEGFLVVDEDAAAA